MNRGARVDLGRVPDPNFVRRLVEYAKVRTLTLERLKRSPDNHQERDPLQRLEVRQA